MCGNDWKRCGWLLGVLVLGLVFSAGFAGAQPGPTPPAGPPHGERLLTPEDRAAIGQIFWQRVKERVGLTDEQANDVRTTIQAQREAMRPDLQALREAHRQLRQLLATPTADPAAIQAAAAQVRSLQAKVFDARIQNQLALRAKLTPEQLGKWVELRKGMGHRGRSPGGAFGGAMM